MDSSRLCLLSALLLTACPPTASCPTGTALSADGRCVGDGGVGDGGHDAHVGPIDAGTGPDGCALHPYWADADGDGHGNASMMTYACEMPTGYAAVGDDCNDACAACHPGATEACDGMLDENCDGQINESCTCTTGMTRACGASATAPCHMGTQTCASGTWGACTGNVDPMVETCNGIDDDCDGMIDDGLTIPTWHLDADHDGHGAMIDAMMACTMPAGYVASADDCDDASAMRFPGNPEICNAIDDDCNGAADNGFACVQGAATTCTTACGSTGTGLCSGTCAVPTGAACSPPAETCNGMDDDCNGLADEGLDSVGVAVTAATGTSLGSPLIVALHGGYGVLYATGSGLAWRLVSSAGVAGAEMQLGADTSPVLGIFDARFDGTNVVVAFYASVGHSVFSFDPSNGARVFPSTAGTTMALPRPAGYVAALLSHVRVVDAGSGLATIYVALNNGSAHVVRRYRIGTTGVGTVRASTADVLNDMSTAYAWDTVLAGDHEQTVYLQAVSGTVALLQTPAGDTVGGTTRGGTIVGAADTSAQIAVDVANATMPPSATNPLGIVMAGMGTGARFATFPGTATTTITGATGSLGNASTPMIRVLAAPGSVMGTRVGHWLVVASNPDASMSNAQSTRAWEVRATATGGASIAAMTVPAETASARRTQISIASDGTTTRLAELDESGNAVTRPIGCM